LVFIVFGTLSNISSSIASFVSVSITEGGDVDTLKYKGETVRGSNVVDLVNDVLRKRKYFNPQGWETFGEALREANVPQDLIGHEDRWKYTKFSLSNPRNDFNNGL
jgi:hypothetical protein